MSDRLSRALPFVALTVAAVLVVVLGQQKRKLVRENEEWRRRYQEAVTQPIRGQYLPPFQTATLDGQPVSVGELPSEGRQVLLVYTTTCQFCLSTIPAWKKLTAAVDTIRSIPATVYGLSLDSVDVTRKYIAQHGLPYPTIRFPNDRMVNLWRAGSVPLTLVVDEQGRTIYSRLGEIKAQATIDSIVDAVRWRPPPPPADSTGDQARPPAEQRTAAR